MDLLSGRKTIDLGVQGMSCDNCEKVVLEAIRDVPGVIGVQVSQETAQATVTFKGEVSIDALIAAVTQAGYKASVR